MRAYILIGFQEERAGPVTAPFAAGLLFSLSLFPGALLKNNNLFKTMKRCIKHSRRGKYTGQNSKSSIIVLNPCADWSTSLRSPCTVVRPLPY